jgi:hypothetical protein
MGGRWELESWKKLGGSENVLRRFSRKGLGVLLEDLQHITLSLQA